MTNTAQLQTLPLLYMLGLAAISYSLDFNGLYGQDAHEYLRQSQVFFQRLQGAPAPLPGPGEAELAGGYPLMGALIQFLGLPAGLALQVLSWLAAAATLALFELNLRVLTPGTYPRSRWVYCMLGLALAPTFMRAGLTVMSDILGLAFMLAALLFYIYSLERSRWFHSFGFAVFSVLAVTTRYALAGVLFLPVVAFVLEYWRARRLTGFGFFIAGGLLAVLPVWWLKADVSGVFLGHSLLQDWSLLNLFKKTFTQASGSISYTLPNIAYIFFPVLHPGFCLSLPGLFLLFKITDVRLYAKRLLTLSLVVYLLFLGGLAHQNLRYLLPAYTVLLLLFFPAWDRFFAYGLYFFKRLTHALIGLTLIVQLVFCVIYFKPTWDRNQLEQRFAADLRHTMLPGSIVYSVDLDIALKSYLPEFEFRNMWIQRYDSFPAGSYVLFNLPKLRHQWVGQAPLHNWERASAQHELQVIKQLPEGWTLYRIENPK